jgi:hypothetical protein
VATSQAYRHFGYTPPGAAGGNGVTPAADGQPTLF